MATMSLFGGGLEMLCLAAIQVERDAIVPSFDDQRQSWSAGPDSQLMDHGYYSSSPVQKKLHSRRRTTSNQSSASSGAGIYSVFAFNQQALAGGLLIKSKNTLKIKRWQKFINKLTARICTHNQKEKTRRAGMKASLSELQSLLPNETCDRKTTLHTLRKAIVHIKELERKSIKKQNYFRKLEIRKEQLTAALYQMQQQQGHQQQQQQLGQQQQTYSVTSQQYDVMKPVDLSISPLSSLSSSSTSSSSSSWLRKFDSQASDSDLDSLDEDEEIDVS